MKRLIAAAALLVCSTLMVDASHPAQRPPQPRPSDGIIAQAQAQAQDPAFATFPNRTVQTAPVASPAQAPVASAGTAPTAPAAGTPDIMAMIQTGLAALIAAFLGKLAIKPAAAPGAPAPSPGGTLAATPTDVGTIVASIFSPGGTSIIGNPAVRSAVDAALLQIVQSGVPGAAITTAAGLVPGVAPFASILEPMLRKAVVAELSARAGAAADPSATVAVPANALSGIEAMLKGIAAQIAAPKAA